MKRSRSGWKRKRSPCSRRSKYRDDRTETLRSSFRKRTSMSALKNWAAMLCVSWCLPSMQTHPDKSSGKRVQHLRIKYDGLGFIPLNELMKKETA